MACQVGQLAAGKSPVSRLRVELDLPQAGRPTLLDSANSGPMAEAVQPGYFLVFADHVNLSGINPLAAAPVLAAAEADRRA